jgi:hypothetical protein
LKSRPCAQTVRIPARPRCCRQVRMRSSRASIRVEGVSWHLGNFTRMNNQFSRHRSAVNTLSPAVAPTAITRS